MSHIASDFVEIEFGMSASRCDLEIVVYKIKGKSRVFSSLFDSHDFLFKKRNRRDDGWVAIGHSSHVKDDSTIQCVFLARNQLGDSLFIPGFIY